MRAIEAEQKRRQRAAAKHERETLRERRLQEKRDLQRQAAAQKLLAANEAEQFAAYLDRIVNLHRDCDADCDWKAAFSQAPPPAPVRSTAREFAARAALHAYRPTLLDSVLGRARKTRAELEQAIRPAMDADERDHREAVAQHEVEVATLNATRSLAARVLRRDATAYGLALEFAGALTALQDVGCRVDVTGAEPDVVCLSCSLDDEAVPREETKLTAAGKLTTKEMAAGRYWKVYQDHVCSAALRLAGEVFSTVPVSRVVVNVGTRQLNTQTGHVEPVTLLAVHFAREALSKINLEMIDPSDSMKNFPHRMKFKSTTGLTPVEPMSPSENWIAN